MVQKTKEIKSRLTNVKTTIEENGLVTYKGKLENYSVKITNNNITMFGSLCKFFHGNNVSSLSLDEMKLALKQLASRIGLPILRGTLVRIDLGINFLTSCQTESYFEQLQASPSWQQTEYKKTGVTFIKHNQELAFYDKIQELQSHSSSDYHLVRDKKIVRIESRLMKQVSQTLKYDKPIKVALLLSTTFRNNLQIKFQKNYDSICTKKRLSFDDARGVADIKNMIYYLGLEKVGGKKAFIDIVKNLRKTKCWPYTKTSTIKQWINRVIKLTPSIKEIDSIQELNEMIELAFLNSDLFNWDNF
jgi:hypothetical protein